MKHTIDKIPLSQMSYERFVSEYLLPERPIVLTSVRNHNARHITAKEVHALFDKKGKKNIGWYDAVPSVAEELMPKLVQQVFAREDMSVRPLAMRVFMQPNGHKTLFHYDGNSLHVFNLTLKGKKRWILISPHTPLPSPPFMFVSLVGKTFYPDESKHDFYDFELDEGELLFIPRYWIHSVETLAEENINYNWVCTPVFPRIDSRSGRRESELLLIRKKLPFINRFLVDEYDQYGGKGEEIIEKYIAEIGISDMLMRIMKELIVIPKTLFLAKEIKSMAKDFEKNNFNL